jgi:cobalt-zinc-cadmium efflux system membrane fusion protein
MIASSASRLVAVFAVAVLSACGPAERGGAPAPASPPEAVDRRAGGGAVQTVALPPGSPQLGQLRIEPIQMGLVADNEVVAPGRIALDARRVVRVAIPFAGRVDRVFVRLGDRVAAGQVLMTLDSPEGGAALTAWLQARALLASSQSAATKAEADAARARELHEHRAIALKDRQLAEHALVEARSSQEQAEAAERQARRTAELLGLSPDAADPRVTIRAPIAGKVLELAVSEGEYRTDPTTPVMTVADLSSVWVTSDVPEASIRHIDVGQHISVELVAFPGEWLEARVTRIADTVNPATRTVQVQAELPNPQGRLRPDMFGRIRHSHAPRLMPLVPTQAIVQNGDGPVVYRESGPNTFTRTPIAVGRTLGDRTVVIGGLEPGARVVVDGAILLKSLGASHR